MSVCDGLNWILNEIEIVLLQDRRYVILTGGGTFLLRIRQSIFEAGEGGRVNGEWEIDRK